MKLRGIIAGALASVLLVSLALAQGSQGTSPLTIPKGGTNASTAAGARTQLGVVIGTNVQAWDADLDALAALSGTSTIYYRSGAGAWSAVTVGGMLSFVTGTLNVGDAELVALAGLTSAADKIPYFTGSGTAALADYTALARTLVANSTAAGMRSTLGVVIGTNVQAWDADLDCIAANSTAGLMAYTGAGTCSYRTLTAPAAGFTITNPAGTAGNPTFVLANDLAALEGLSSTGIARRTGTDAWSVGTAVTNAELATMAASTVKANATAGSATPTDVTLDSTLGFSGSTLKCTTGTTSQLGCLKPDGTTVTVSGGTISAVGGVATSVAVGTTTISGGNNGYDLYNNAGVLGNHFVSTAGGFINRFRNGTFEIWQRGTSVSIAASGNYGPDGWKVSWVGGTAPTAGASQAAINGTYQQISLTGTTGNTSLKIAQRIESYIAAPLASQTVTVQFAYFQNTGGSVAPKVSTCYASTQDNFGTCTADLAATTLTSCANGGWCTEAYTFTTSANAQNGYEVTIDCNSGFTAAQNCRIGATDIRVTPGVSTGINSNPPSPELRPIAVEQTFCFRYFRVITNPKFMGIAGATNAPSRMGMTVTPSFRLSAPTLTMTGNLPLFFGGSGTVGTSTLSSIGTNYSTQDNLEFDGTSPSVLTIGYPVMIYQTGTATLTVGGGEL